jgi:hypothetical protein
MTKNLQDTFRWSEYYLQQAQTKIRETEPETVMQFASELGEFVSAVNSRWMGKQLEHLTEAHRRNVNDLFLDLCDLYDKFRDHGAQLARAQSLRQEIDGIALPAIDATRRAHPYEKWGRAPYQHTASLLKEGADLPPP